MKNNKFAILGFFIFIAGLILLFNSYMFVSSNYCSPVIGSKLIVNIVYETLVGMLILGGPIMVAITLDIRSRGISAAFALIIVVAVAFLVLSSGLGILGGSPCGTSCLAQSGYICQTPIAHNNILTATIGQTTGSTWTTTDLVWVPQGTSAPNATGNILPCGAPTANAMYWAPVSTPGVGFTCSAGSDAAGTNNALANGQTTQAYFVFQGAIPPVATSAAGQIWAYYQLQKGGSVYRTQIATLTLKTV